MDLSQYVFEALRTGEEIILYRGAQSNHQDLPSILLLTPPSTQLVPETLRKMAHEYSLRDELDSAWAVRPLVLSEHRGQMTLVLEDPGGETLDRFLLGPMEMTRFLRFAVGTAAALSGLHKKELIHKDVKSANVLVNPATGQARLMGFGIASRLPRERQAPEPPEFIAGTLAYMAPEQTGRMNRSTDSRSDLYPKASITEVCAMFCWRSINVNCRDRSRTYPGTELCLGTQEVDCVWRQTSDSFRIAFSCSR